MIDNLLNSIQHIKGLNIVKSVYNNSYWCKIQFGTNKKLLLSKQEEITNIILKNNLHYSIDVAWKWEQVEYEGLIFNNPTPTYEFFVTHSEKTQECFIFSDTNDKLYSISLYELEDAYKKQKQHIDVEIHTYRRTLYGFIIEFTDRKNAEIFNQSNIFNRKISWEKKGKNYLCHLYMFDKEDLCPNISLSSIISNKEECCIDKKEEIYKMIQSGQMTLDEFKKLK